MHGDKHGLLPDSRYAGARGRGLGLNAQFVHRIPQVQQPDVRLQRKNQFRIVFSKVLRPDDFPLRLIERFDVRPFQPDHVQCRFDSAAHPGRV